MDVSHAVSLANKMIKMMCEHPQNKNELWKKRSNRRSKQNAFSKHLAAAQRINDTVRLSYKDSAVDNRRFGV